MPTDIWEKEKFPGTSVGVGTIVGGEVNHEVMAFEVVTLLNQVAPQQ